MSLQNKNNNSTATLFTITVFSENTHMMNKHVYIYILLYILYYITYVLLLLLLLLYIIVTVIIYYYLFVLWHVNISFDPVCIIF